MQENNDLYPAPFYFPVILDTDGASITMHE